MAVREGDCKEKFGTKSCKRYRDVLPLEELGSLSAKSMQRFMPPLTEKQISAGKRWEKGAVIY